MANDGGGKRWAMLALLFVARIGLSFEFQTMGSVADPLIAELHLNFAEIGTLIGLFMLPGLFLATGHHRNGILLAKLSANLVADAVCNTSSSMQ